MRTVNLCVYCERALLAVVVVVDTVICGSNFYVVICQGACGKITIEFYLRFVNS